jgi:hypothetical protein
MQLSDKLLDALSSWGKRSTPVRLFHGCRSQDFGVDVASSSIKGDRWFSANAYYAGEYAWFHTEQGFPLRFEVHLFEPLIAIECPKQLRGERFVGFLESCFPEVGGGYGLSRKFQNSIGTHLQECFGGAVKAYISHSENEVLIPNCAQFIESCKLQRLPQTKQEYARLSGLVDASP